MNTAIPGVLLTRGKRPLTTLEKALVSSGRPLRWYARKIAEYGATPRQLAYTEATLRRYLRNGDAPIYYARRLTLLLGHSLDSSIHDLLLKPRCTWPAGADGSAPDATGTARNSASVASDAKASNACAGIAARAGADSPTPRRMPRIERGRMTTLRLV